MASPCGLVDVSLRSSQGIGFLLQRLVDNGTTEVIYVDHALFFLTRPKFILFEERFNDLRLQIATQGERSTPACGQDAECADSDGREAFEDLAAREGLWRD